jgi:hypothetical protein
VHERSEREYPARVREPEYDGDFLVRRVTVGGQFKWKGEKIFVSETLGGEPIGLQAEDERMYTIYFAAFPLGRFDSYKRTISPLPREDEFKVGAREGEIPPSPAPHPLHPQTQKVSGMSPV